MGRPFYVIKTHVDFSKTFGSNFSASTSILKLTRWVKNGSFLKLFKTLAI